MTQLEAALRLRQQIKETTAGYIATDEPYDALDSGQNRVIQIGLGYQRGMKYKDPFYECNFLKPLITLDPLNTTTIGSGYQEYALPSDFIETYEANYSTSNAGTQYPCALLGFKEAIQKSSNTYAQAAIKTPVYYIKAEKIGFFPQPSGAGANNYTHYYYKQPQVVTSTPTTGDFTLREETHESIIEFALYQIHLEKREYDKAQIHLNNFQEFINKLL